MIGALALFMLSGGARFSSVTLTLFSQAVFLDQQIVMMNLVEIVVELEKGPRMPEAMVTGKPQLTPLNAIFLADGYDILAGATGKWLIGG